MSDLDVLRRCIFRPYRPGKGPSFRLMTWDTHRTDNRGQTVIGYRLTMHTTVPHMDGSRGYPALTTRTVTTVLFEGTDFAGSPMHADDSDDTIRSLMTFLTLKPGDTDADYFEGYTDAQRDYCSAHAEALSMEVTNRYGEG